MKKLLSAGYQLCTPHGLLPEVHLAETIGAFGPIAAALVRPHSLGMDAYRKGTRLPGEMKSDEILANVLEDLLPRSPDLQPRARKENSHASAYMPFRFHAAHTDARDRNVCGIVEVGA